LGESSGSFDQDRRWLAAALATAATLLAAALLPGGLLAHPRAALALLGIATFAWLLGSSRAPTRARAALGALLALRLLTLVAEPTLSDDIHRYVHEARASRLGLATPYAVPPSQIVPPPDDGTTALVNHPDIPAAYPPTSQLFLLATVWPGDLLSAPRVVLRFALVLCDALIVLLLFRRRDRNPRAFLLYGLHPLPLLEAGIGSHLDVLGVALLTLAVVGARPAWLRGALAGLAAGVKPVALLALFALPLRRHALILGAAGAALGILLPTLPYLAVDAPLTRGITEYGTRWEAQPTFYAALETAFTDTFEARAAAGQWAHAHVSWGGVLIEEGGATRLALGDAQPVKRPLLLDARFFARGLALALLLGALGFALRLSSPHARTAWALAAVWLLTPTLHPWYLLWPLPLAALLPARGLLAWAAAAPLAYEAAMRAAATDVWAESWWPRAVGLLALTLGTALDVALSRGAAQRRADRGSTSPRAAAG